MRLTPRQVAERLRITTDKLKKLNLSDSEVYEKEVVDQYIKEHPYKKGKPTPKECREILNELKKLIDAGQEIDVAAELLSKKYFRRPSLIKSLTLPDQTKNKELIIKYYDCDNFSKFEEFDKLDTPLSAEQEYNLFKQYNYYKFKSITEPEYTKKSSEVLGILVKKNMGLIDSAGKKYFHSNIVDFRQNGVVCLIININNFDYTSGLKFSTYGYTCLSGQFITMYKNHISKSAVSLEAPCVVDSCEKDIDLESTISDIIETLKPKYRDILRKKYGIGEAEYSSREIAELYGLSTSRIWVILNEAEENFKLALESRGLYRGDVL